MLFGSLVFVEVNAEAATQQKEEDSLAATSSASSAIEQIHTLGYVYSVRDGSEPRTYRP